jgi:hypothetical protein
MKMRRGILFGTAVALVAAGALATAGPQATAVKAVQQAKDGQVVKFNYKKGKVFKYKTETKMEMEGMMEMVMDMSMIQNIGVKDVKDGGATLAMSFEDFKMESEGGPPGSEDGMAEAQDELEGTEITLDVDPQGKIKKIDAGDAGMFASSMMSQVGFLGVVYPKEAIAPGSTWKSEYDLKNMPGMGPMGAEDVEMEVTGDPIVLNFKVESMDKAKDRAVISYTMKGTNSISIDAQGFQMDMDLTMDAVGELQVRLSDGFPTKSTASISTITDMMGMEMNQKMTVSMVLQK